jgi:predicted dehydrogenase
MPLPSSARPTSIRRKPEPLSRPGCTSTWPNPSAALAKEKGLHFLIDFQTRADPFFIEAMKRVHSGALGTLAFGESIYHAGRLKPKSEGTSPEDRLSNWVFDKQLSGDIIVEQNIHTLDVMNWAMNHTPPERVSGLSARHVRTDVGDTNDTYSLVFEYPNDVGITFSSRQFTVPGGTPGGILNRMYGSDGALFTKYAGEVMIRGGADNFYRGGSSPSLYKKGIVTNIASFQKAVAASDVAQPTVAPSVVSNLVAIFGRMAAERGRSVSWEELMADESILEPDLEGLQA